MSMVVEKSAGSIPGAYVGEMVLGMGCVTGEVAFGAVGGPVGAAELRDGAPRGEGSRGQAGAVATTVAASTTTVWRVRARTVNPFVGVAARPLCGTAAERNLNGPESPVQALFR